jgi:filamentous hemagglutinin family protein
LGKTRIGVTVGALAQLLATITVSTSSTQAQIIPDTTLGAENSRLTPNVNVPSVPSSVDLIEGGAQRGSNLFHSFLEFNVNNGQQVYFANPTGIDTIFSRVTGSNLSNILGTLGVNGNASLFLLNPNGVIFGPNARLDINGSFLATTASSVQFPGGTEFSANNPQAPSLLTINVPLGVQYGTQSGTISNRGNLSVGQDLTLAAGNLDVQGQLQAGRDLTLQAQDTVQVRDTVLNPFIAVANGKLLVQGNQRVDIFALNHPNSGFYSGGDMVLRSANTVGGDAHYWAGGSFRIETLDGDVGDLYSPKDPIILTIGDVSLGDYTGGSLHILAGGSVTLGNVTITGTDENTIHPDNTILYDSSQTIASLASVVLSDGTSVTIRGNTIPTLDVRAGVNWSAFSDFGSPFQAFFIGNVNPQFSFSSPSSSSITVGSINNNSGSNSNIGQILLTNQYRPNPNLTGSIQTGVISTYGNVAIDSTGSITAGSIDTTLGDNTTLNRTAGAIQLIANNNILAQGDIRSNIRDNLPGNGGNISFISRQGGINTTAGNISSESPNGLAGNVTFNAAQDIQSGDIDSSSNTTSGFSVVRLQSTQGSVFLNGAQINTTNTNSAQFAGFIYVDAARNIEIRNSSNLNSNGYSGQILIGAEIQPANINISDSSLNVSNNFSASNQDSTLAGDIYLNARDRISITNSTLSADGYFGQIFVTDAQTIAIENSNLRARNRDISSPLVAGNLVLSSTGNMAITNSNLSSSTVGLGTGGTIDIITGSLLTNNSQIVADTQGQGSAGIITITAANEVRMQNNSVISASANSLQNIGNGGQITITVENGSLIADTQQNNDILAIAFNGQGGEVNLQASGIFGLTQQINLSSQQLQGLRSNTTNDIVARSVNTDGRVELPINDNNPSTPSQNSPTNNASTTNDPSNNASVNNFTSNNSLRNSSTYNNSGTNSSLSNSSSNNDSSNNDLENDNFDNEDFGNDSSGSIDANLGRTSGNLTRLMPRRCGAGDGTGVRAQGQLFITGRGGLPPSPDDPLSNGAIATPWVTRDIGRGSHSATVVTPPASRPKARLVEAQGMVFGPNGEIILIAESATVTPNQLGFSTPSCF